MAKTARTEPATPKKSSTRQAKKANPGMRQRMIAEAAYYRAERRGFVSGDTVQDWLEAEKEIDRSI
jgi:hypothetical protein